MARRHSAKDPKHLRCGCRIQRCQVHKGRNSSSACPNITRASRRRSVRPGTRTTQTRPSGSCATWPGVWSMRNRASGSILDWRRSSPSAPRPAARTPAIARLHQHRRERARHGAPGHPQRQTLETRRDGAQMDRRRPAGGPENLPSLKAYRQLPILRKLSRNTGSRRQCLETIR